MLGIAAALLGYGIRRQRTAAPRPLITRLRHARNDRERYTLLLPYANRPEMRPFVKQLEKNLFEGGNEKVDWKSLERLVL